MGCSKQKRDEEYAAMILAPLAGAALGFAASDNPKTKHPIADRLLGVTVGLVVGGLAGLAAAALIDAAPEKKAG